MLGEEEHRAIERLVSLVENSGERLEHVRYIGGDIKDHVHPGLPRTCGQARGVVQEHLIGADLQEQGREPGQIGEDSRAEHRQMRVLPRKIHGASVS